MRRAYFACLSLSLACAAEPVARTHAPAPTPAPTSPREPSPLERLAALAVHHDDFARAELYSWTTLAQLDSLRAGACVLQADAALGVVSPFHRALQQLASSGAPEAALATLLLEHEGLTKRRYAWTAAFATVLGLGPRRYGDVLVRIELAPDAWLARLDLDAAPALAVVDLQGQPVPLARVLAEPLRLAAIYHVGRTRDGHAPAFREYVVTSEAMVTSVSAMTPALDEQLAAELALLDALIVEFATLPERARVETAVREWARADSGTPLARWHAALAFDSPRYRASPVALRDIAAALRETRRGEPLIRHPRSEPCRP